MEKVNFRNYELLGDSLQLVAVSWCWTSCFALRTTILVSVVLAFMCSRQLAWLIHVNRHFITQYQKQSIVRVLHMRNRILLQVLGSFFLAHCTTEKTM